MAALPLALVVWAHAHTLEAMDFSWAQSSSWTVARETPEDGTAPFCRAEARFLSPGGLNVTGDVAFEVRENEQATFVLAQPAAFPKWMGRLPGPETGTGRFEGARFQFDAHPPWPMRYTIAYDTLVNRYDFGSDPRFIDELAASRTLSLEMPSEARERAADADRNGNSPAVFLVLANTPQLAMALRSCLVSLHQSKPFGRVTISDAFTEKWATPPPIATRLEFARERSRLLQNGDALEQALALLDRGNTAADALRLGEAATAFADLRRLVAQGCPLTPSIRLGLERYFTVLLLAERLDDAAELARSLPENEAMLAAVTLARGDYEGARLLAKAAARRISGLSADQWRELALLTQQQVPLGLTGGVCPAMRKLFLWWAMAAFGQEQALVKERCENCVFPDPLYAPASAAANMVGNWVEVRYMREGAADSPEIRHDLGLAAFWRGASLLRAGYLQAVSVDFDDAAYELHGKTGKDGWEGRIGVFQAELLSARGRAREALDAVRGQAATMACGIGVQSLPWLEAKALESELAKRLGEAEAAEDAARQGLAEAAAVVPAGHSLTLRLKRALCQALFARGQLDEATGVALEAMELHALPPADAARMREVLGKVDAVDKTSRRETQARHARTSPQEKERIAGQVIREQQDILAQAVGLPPMRGDMPVAARVERIRFLGSLTRLSGPTAEPGQANAVKLLRLALYFDEMRAHARLRGSYVGGGPHYYDHLVETTRGNFVDDHFDSILDKKLTPTGLRLLASLYRSAQDWSSLGAMFPGEKRRELLPGEAAAGLESIMDRLYEAFGASPGDASKTAMQHALAHAQAASRGEVLANLLTRTLLVANPGMRESFRHDAQQAINGELWLRSERGVLYDLIKHANPLNTWVDDKRAQIRQRALGRPYYEVQVSNKFFSHIVGDASANNKTQSMTWVGASRYECSIDQVQRRLADDAALIAWLPLEKTTQIFLITKTGWHWVQSPMGQAAVGNASLTILRYIKAVTDNWEHALDVPFPAEAAHALYTGLFEPVAGRLAGVSHLYAAQLGATGGIPLALLVTAPPAAGEEPRWLADRFALTRLPALANPAVFDRRSPAGPRPARPLLAAGDPQLLGPINKKCTTDIASLRSVADLDRGLCPLPESGAEINEIASELGLSDDDKERFVLARDRATPGAILDRLRGERFRYLLFATHGLTSFEDVGEPALVFSTRSGERRPDDDGLLRASDIVGLDIDTDMVLLSACKTSPSGEEGAEPLAGLASAFLMAGARSVLSTQWQVVSEAARFVSTDMMSALQAGEEPARALQQTLTRLRARKTPAGLERSPAYWAVYELIGFPGATSPRHRPN